MRYLFSELAKKDFKRLPPDVQKRIFKKLDFFVNQPEPLSYAESLTNSSIGSYRFRVGNYRIVFDCHDNDVWILRLGHRKNIYK